MENRALVLSLNIMDDYEPEKDSHWGTECALAVLLWNLAPAKFRAIVYHGIFLPKLESYTWLKPRPTD